jgi:tRNA threonylcarbamoyladenosine biosynthesis protein TsaE
MQISEREKVFTNVVKEELTDLAVTLLKLGGSRKIWLLEGEMGAGKTTLIKELGRQLGVIDVMNSPTFSIVNEYRTHSDEKIYHFDFYRLKQEVEAVNIGVDEYFYSGSYCFIEWPDKIPNLIPDAVVRIKIEPTNEKSRTIHFSTHG